MKRLAMAALLLPALAWGQNYLPFRMMSSSTDPFPYYQDSRVAQPAGLVLDSVRISIDTAWNTWNAVQCAAPKVVARGYTSTTVPRPSDPYDLFSVTPVWITASGDPDYLGIIGSRYILSVTLPLSYTGVLQTCDTYFNAVDFTWSTSPSPPSNAAHVQSVMLHEAGHCLGMDHSGNADNVMQDSIVPGQTKTVLGPDDIQNFCQRNPATGAPGAPCLADGGCGGASNVKCITQTLISGTATYCANGCTINTGAICDLPLSCQASTAFSPTYNGACMLPNNNVTAVGKPCGRDPDCGSATGQCFLPRPLPSGFAEWANGYCTQSCEAGQPPCPAGSTCVTLGDSSKRCLKTCRVGLADCRSEYACALSTGGGICIPRCYTSNDCVEPTQYECRTCDGLCVNKQNLSGRLGDTCSQDSQCGAGQVCLAIDPRQSQKICVQQCGRGCGICPSGSTCHPTDRGDLYCLLDCSGPGSCPPGLRCTDFPTGRACMPMCTQTTDCPVGQQCQGGECLNPFIDDGGTCTTLCNPVDSGHPIVIGPDGGHGGGLGSGGCGCQSASPGVTMAMIVGWVMALFAVRRLAWRRR